VPKLLLLLLLLLVGMMSPTRGRLLVKVWMVSTDL
jgi:hypothetical protein